MVSITLLRTSNDDTIVLFKDSSSHTVITLYNVCSVHRGMFSTSGDVQYIGGCSVHRGDIMSTSGDIMSTSGGYHEYIGGCSVHRGNHDECGGIP